MNGVVILLVHLIVSTFSAMVLGLSAGRLNTVIAYTSLGLGASAGLLAGHRFKTAERALPRLTFTKGLFYSFIIFAAVRHFLSLLYYSGDALKTLDPNNSGDLTMHIQYIRHIAFGSFWPLDPGFAGRLLRYPLGMDLYSALWEIAGVPVESSLFLTGLVMTAAAIAVLDGWMGWWGVGAFFLNGGLANWQVIFGGGLHDYQNGIAWKNFFLSLWMTQRGLLFAVPAGAYLLRMVIETLLGERDLSRQEKALCAVLWSSLAWFHMHTFLIVSLVLGLCIIIYGKLRPMLGVLIPVFATGLVFFLFSTEGLTKTGFLRIQWGWVKGHENFFGFWLMNLGPWLLLWAISIWHLAKKGFARIRPFAAVVFSSFFVFTFVMVAPWDWDNIKVLFWLYLLAAWIVRRTWLERLSPPAAFLIGCIAFFPGAVSVVSSLPGSSAGVALYKASEVWEAKAALREVPADAVLAAAPVPNHPAMFWGAAVAMDYPGHSWSHGIDYSRRKGELRRLFSGSGDWPSVARHLGVTHIYWGEDEKKEYGTLDPVWRHELKNVSSSQKVEVYDVSTSPDQR